MKPLSDIVDSTMRSSKIPDRVDKIEKVIRYKDCVYNIVNIAFLNFKNKVSKDYSPTIVTVAPPFIYELNRVFTITELLQLQGFPRSFKIVVSKNQIIKQIGNSMSVCVVKRVIKEALTCL